MGDPGAGKSTFLNRITAALCDTWLGHDAQAAEKRLGLKERPLPVLIRMGELAEHIATCRERKEGPPTGPDTPSWIAHFLERFGADRNWKLDAAYFLERFRGWHGAGAPRWLGRSAVTGRAGTDQRVGSGSSARLCGLPVRGDQPPGGLCREGRVARLRAGIDEPLTDPAIDGFLGRWSAALFHDTPGGAESHRAELLGVLHGRRTSASSRAIR